MTGLPASPALLVLPRLRIQNANAISSPLTHGFPSMTAFLGFMWALERRLADTEFAIALQSVGVICHGFQEQTTEGGYVKAFRLTRNPVDKDGGAAAIVEEGRIHLEVTLVFGADGRFTAEDDTRRQAIAAGIAAVVAGMRIAGGSVFLPNIQDRNLRPALRMLDQDAEMASRQFRRWRRHWLPGFALVSRDDLLQQRIARMAAQGMGPLDAWLDLSRFNWRSHRIETTDERTGEPKVRIEWDHDRTEGWIVPIPVGYGALSDLHEPGAVRNARDTATSFRFVESLYSIGQWIGPHRLTHPSQLLWYAHSDDARRVYRCRNDYARGSTTSND
ncbi:type I-F CRISPR-associated protein Csy2 [Luteimonas huabeiensis]|uniref:type I-F CRISPR-associated protein Csy2 n=1 Tax=Luteimonas huabeiensis TaxID=1244513 RepID=UPI0004673A57|nr:type I-F CRISPR-associated protein Csy2 [Luteimonas huabeiensis]